MTFKNSQYLVKTDWLADHLNDENVQVVDCTVYLIPDSDTNKPLFEMVSGLTDYRKGHIPGAAFVDMIAEFSDPESCYPFTLPSAKNLAHKVAIHGLDRSKHVILYGNGVNGGISFAARAWWVLRSCGFENVSILEGGYVKWVSDGYEVSSESVCWPETAMKQTEGEVCFCDKTTVLNALTDKDYRVIDSLPQESYMGTSERNYGRPGHIQGSHNVPWGSVIDDKGIFIPAEKLEAQLGAAGINKGNKIITYCGGGIAASVIAFALALNGYRNISIYDRSLFEWANDKSLPMVF